MTPSDGTAISNAMMIGSMMFSAVSAFRSAPMTLVASTYSPHIAISPPITSCFCASVPLVKSVLVIGSKCALQHCTCTYRSSELTVEVLWVAVVVLRPVDAVRNAVQVPARSQDCRVAQLCHSCHLSLVSSLPHFYYRVRLYLMFTIIL